MADITITAANVKRFDANSKVLHVKAGEVIAAGEAVYQGTDSKVYKADNTTAGGAKAAVVGMSVNSALAIDQEVDVVLEGDIVCDGATKGIAYMLSANPGKLCPVADVVAGKYATFVALAITATRLRVKPVVSGIVV